MRFLVIRTSSSLDDSPCENAYHGSEPLEINNWFIDINTLEEFMAFQKRYGQLVLNSNTIEIYDDYRE